MLLHWVLTRDEMTVAAMAERCGAIHVELGRIMHVRPETWDDVVQAYLMGDEPPTERSRSDLKTAIDKGDLELIPAWQKIYKALRSGTLDSWARPNGSGALIRIDPIEYERFRFRSLDGHDFVIPVDIYNEPLCPHPLAEYLTGAIPATTTPTVWPDPLFSAQQAMSLWPPYESNAATSEPGITPAADVDPAQLAFVGWMRSEKKAYGSYPPRDTNGLKPDRPTWGEWAKKKKISRSVVQGWVTSNNLSEHRGAPRKNSAQK
jgi:hypothetical protein